MSKEVEQYRCIRCKSKIPIDAKICIHCNSYQKEWKNNFRFLAGMTGLVSITASIVIFIITKLPEFRKIVAWNDDVEVVSFVNNHEIIISNIGDGDVFIEYIELSRPENAKFKKSTTIRIQENIEQGTVIKHKLLDRNIFNDGIYLADGDISAKNEREQIVISALTGSSCYRLDIRDIKDRMYLHNKKAYKNRPGSNVMNTSYIANIYFYSFKKKKSIKKPFEVIAMVVFRDNQECRMKQIEMKKRLLNSE